MAHWRSCKVRLRNPQGLEILFKAACVTYADLGLLNQINRELYYFSVLKHLNVNCVISFYLHVSGHDGFAMTTNHPVALYRTGNWLYNWGLAHPIGRKQSMKKKIKERRNNTKRADTIYKSCQSLCFSRRSVEFANRLKVLLKRFSRDEAVRLLDGIVLSCRFGRRAFTPNEKTQGSVQGTHIFTFCITGVTKLSSIRVIKYVNFYIKPE